MIKVNNLNFAYQKEKVIKNINFELKKGDIKINSKEIKGVRNNTAVILQNYGLFPWKTVYQNLALGLKIREFNKNMIKKTVNAALKRLDIFDLKKDYPADLSGGEKQRVAVGRSLVIKPDLLLMDEPFSALDALTREKMQNLILEIHKRDNFSFVIVTHDIAEAAFLGHKIAVMKEGKIIEVLKNSHFSEKNLREKEEFFELQKKLRKLMVMDKGVGIG